MSLFASACSTPLICARATWVVRFADCVRFADFCAFLFGVSFVCEEASAASSEPSTEPPIPFRPFLLIDWLAGRGCAGRAPPPAAASGTLQVGAAPANTARIWSADLVSTRSAWVPHAAAAWSPRDCHVAKAVSAHARLGVGHPGARVCSVVVARSKSGLVSYPTRWCLAGAWQPHDAAAPRGTRRQHPARSCATGTRGCGGCARVWRCVRA